MKILFAALVLSFSLSTSLLAEKQFATGRVFHDANSNGVYDTGERLLKGVGVSNGRDVVETDRNGRYRVSVTDDTIVFVIKPEGWACPLNENRLPRFHYIHKPNGSPDHFRYPGVAPTGPLPESIDFPLYSQQEPKLFKAVLFADPKPRSQTEVDYVTHDIVEDLVGTDASFGVTLGDITFDGLELFESQNAAIALLGIPWYNIIGNHDVNREAETDELSDETFERVYGPSYYSFDYGRVHFLALDNISWYQDKENNRPSYKNSLGKDQVAFIRNDLARVPRNKLVVLLMHIPIESMEEREGIFRLIERRPYTFSVSGHTHYHEHRFIGEEGGWQGAEPHHHMINVTASGSWWGGIKDERQIPHTTMKDGVPNGYTIVTFDGQRYSIDYKAASLPADRQLHVYAPDEVSQDQLADLKIIANIYNGNEKSKVQLNLSTKGESLGTVSMEQKAGVDPVYQQVYDRETAALAKISDGERWMALPAPRTTAHLWHSSVPADLSAGTYLITVLVELENGSQYTAERVLRVTGSK